MDRTMSLCRCEMCRPADPDPMSTRAWALECEARMLAAMTITARRAYLERPMVQGRRMVLEMRLIEMWRQRHEPRSPA